MELLNARFQDVKFTPLIIVRLFLANVTDHGLSVDKIGKPLMSNLISEHLFLPNVTDRRLKLLLEVINTKNITFH